MEQFDISIDLSRCLTDRGFIETLKNEFCFPAYFGGSLDAVNDCMRDLEWIKQKKIVICLRNENKARKISPERTQSVINLMIGYRDFFAKTKSNKILVVKFDR